MQMGYDYEKGVGHLTYKDKLNPENNNTFKMLYITEVQ